MYSTKRVHKNLHKFSYTTIGDPYQPPPKKSDRNSRIHGVQFQTAFPKKGDLPHQVCFEKLKFGPHGKQVEQIPYLSTQPLEKRRLGFGSHDAFRRDEFTSNMRTEQIRGVISTEKAMQRRTYISAKEGKIDYTKRLGERIDSLDAQVQELERSLGYDKRLERENADTAAQGQRFQYDYGRNIRTEFNPKSMVDSWFRPDPEREKRYGRTHTTSLQHGLYTSSQSKVDKKAYEHAHYSATQEFFDCGHLGAGRKLG